MTAAQRWALGAWLAFFALAAGIVARTTFSTDVSAFLPRSPTPEQQVLVEQLRVDGVIVMAETTAKPEPGRSGLAVSQAVLTAIAKDARLTF